MSASFSFKAPQSTQRVFTLGDVLALLFVAVLIYVGARLAFKAPHVVEGPDIILSIRVLPWYALFSVTRMAAAYGLSLLFTLFYGRMAAYNRQAESILLPLLDVLQSVPILSFLPVVLLGLSTFLPQSLAAEVASIILIFTSQAWNLTFSWYQSLSAIPKELREASSIFRLNGWMRFKTLELPFAGISLIWNSMVSWAGGWFFLMAAEIFTVGAKDFRLPGLGAFLSEAAQQGNFTMIAWGLAALILTVIALDQLIWRPLLAWSDRFRVEMVESDEPPKSWFYDAVSSSRIAGWLGNHIFTPIGESLDRFIIRRYPARELPGENEQRPGWLAKISWIGWGGLLVYGIYGAVGMLSQVPLTEWGRIGLAVLFTFLRVLVALLVALAWTIPLGVAIGSNRRVAAILQPMVQIAASIPATALFPIVLLFVLRLPGGLNLAAVLLMLMGTQWYLLFNVIAGANSIPQDLKYTSELMQLSGWQRWRTLILPALFPYLVTGAITAGGGAWNASIVAEYQNFQGQTLQANGVGAVIAQATAIGNYPLLLAATLSMILAVVLFNRLVWRRLYLIAETKYRME